MASGIRCTSSETSFFSIRKPGFESRSGTSLKALWKAKNPGFAGVFLVLWGNGTATVGNDSRQLPGDAFMLLTRVASGGEGGR
jgi:hypothetical protein